jgi:hypothetical protein
MSGKQTPNVKLDWSRLLGFDQVAAPATATETPRRLSDPRLAKIGSKIGVKTGLRASA